jgi:NADH:ubiquinone oxidoreductase subunit E
MFSAETESRFKHLVSIYPQKRSALIPMLMLAQKEQGYVTAEAMEYIATYLGLSASDVESTLTFYTLLRRKPAGKYHILICTNLSCMLRGSKPASSANSVWISGRSRRTGYSRQSSSNAWVPARRRPFSR